MTHNFQDQLKKSWFSLFFPPQNVETLAPSLQFHPRLCILSLKFHSLEKEILSYRNPNLRGLWVQQIGKILWYCGWKRSCTIWDMQKSYRLLEFCKLLTAEFLSSTVHAITSNTPTLYFCILAKDYGVPSDNEIWPQRPTNYSQIWRILTMTFKLLLSKNVSMRTSNFFEVQIKQLFPAPHIFNHFHFTIQNFTKRWCGWGSVSALRCFRFSERSSCSRKVMRSRVSPVVTRSDSLITVSQLYQD